VTEIYQCTMCKSLHNPKGVANHMRLTHGLTRDLYDFTELPIDARNVEPDYAISQPDVVTGSRRWPKDKVIATWCFTVSGDYDTIFKKGNLRIYRLWITEQIRRVNKKHGRRMRENRYLDDYF